MTGPDNDADTTLADVITQLARRLGAASEPDGVRSRIVDAAIAEIGGADRASITVVRRRVATTSAATDDVVLDIDRVQYDAGEGPCLTVAREHLPLVSSDDITTDARYPRFGPAAAPFGVRAMASFRLATETTVIGALNVYATAPAAFDADGLRMGRLLAEHAALALQASERTANLRIALQSRDVIGQAKGVLMERYKISQAEAFELLLTASQHTHRKLRDVAEHLTRTGELVTPPSRPTE